MENLQNKPTVKFGLPCQILDDLYIMDLYIIYSMSNWASFF